MGWLSIINSVTNISRLGTFKNENSAVKWKIKIKIICLQRLQKSFDDGTERLGQGAGGGGHPQEDTQVCKETVARDKYHVLNHYMAEYVQKREIILTIFCSETWVGKYSFFLIHVWKIF